MNLQPPHPHHHHSHLCHTCLFPSSESGDGYRNRSAVSLLQQEHIHQWEICRWDFFCQTQHAHPFSAWRNWGQPSVLPGATTHRLPWCYQEHQAVLYGHKVSAHTSYCVTPVCLLSCSVWMSLNRRNWIRQWAACLQAPLIFQPFFWMYNVQPILCITQIFTEVSCKSDHTKKSLQYNVIIHFYRW